MPVTTYDLFGQQATGTALTADPTSYTLGMQWAVILTAGQTAVLSGLRFYSAAGAGVLPTHIINYDVNSQAAIDDQVASWSGAAGSGWVTALFTVPPSLASGVKYKAAVYQPNAANWYSNTANYWTSGAGSAGVTNGPLSAPNSAGGAQGQDSFVVGGPTYPNAGSGANYWIDVVVAVTTPAAGGGAPDRHHHRTPAGRIGQHRPGGRGGVR